MSAIELQMIRFCLFVLAFLDLNDVKNEELILQGANISVVGW